MFNKNIKKLIAKILVFSLCFTCKGTIYFIKSIKTYGKEVIKQDLYNQYVEESDKILGWNGGSSETGNTRIISSELSVVSIHYSNKDDKVTFYYSDDYFKNDSTTYNNHLSTTSIELAMSGVGTYQEDDRDKYANAKDALSKMGFENITPNYDFLHKPTNTSMGTVCANKHIYLKDDSSNVNEYNLIAVVMRSANYKNEWNSNFNIGLSGDHAGFTESATKIYDYLTTFYNEHKDDFGGTLPVKLWIVGYSRGAAVANMLGGKVTDNASAFNTRKEDIYCYTLGTPKGALVSEHTSPSLDSYTNIHNVVSYSDLFQMVGMERLGFSRYGVDHVIPHYASDKVHDPVKRNAIIAANNSYLPRYEKMLEKLRKIDPSIIVDLNDFKMYKLILFDFSTFQYMIFSRLGEEPFTDTSPEKEYYQAYEFFSAAINDILGDELLNCEYSGTAYDAIKGRERYCSKYQDLLGFFVNTFLESGRSSEITAKIQENAMSNLLVLLPLVIALKGLVYYEGDPQPRDHYIPTGYDPSETYEESDFQNAYEQLQLAYQALFNGAFTDEEYDFLMSKHVDVTDFLLDLLNIDYRTNYLPSQSLLGTMYQNLWTGVSPHIGAYYLAWLQTEDEYFDNPPVDTISCDGIKTVTFTDLSDSKIEIYDMSDNKICEYTVDASNNITYTELIENKYVDVAKSYNPEGLEIRLPSNVSYKAIVTANKSLGTAVYREYFSADSTFYRKEKQLGTIQLTDDEYYEMIFNESSIANVYSCYLYSDLDPYELASFTKVDVKGVEKGSGYDSYTFGAEPQFTKKSNLLSMLYDKNLTASRSEITVGEYELASPSEIEIIVASESEAEYIEESKEIKATETDTSEAENESEKEEISVIEEIGETEPVETEETSLDAEIEPEETIIDDESELEESSTDEQIESNEESITDEQNEPEEISAEELSEPQENPRMGELCEPQEETVSGFTDTLEDVETYKVNFTTMAEGDFYYDDGSGFVKGKSGDTYAAGTKIKFTAPFTYDSRPFYGWTITDESGKYINAKGVDTPKIYDESDATNSTYVLELKNYDINIFANYLFKEYKLTLSVDTSKGTIDPDGTDLEYLSVADFDSVKDSVNIINVGKNEFLYWNDGKANYAKLSDYTWEYKTNVTLKAIFKSDSPVVPPKGGGGSDSGGGSGGSGPLGLLNKQEMGYVINTLSGNNVYNKTPNGNWVSEKILNLIDFYRYEVNAVESTDIANKEFETISIGSKRYLSNGLYKIKNKEGRGYYYLFDSNGLMQTGFKVFNGKTYYFEETGDNKGAMVYGEKIINGILFKFNADGSLIQENSTLQVVAGFWLYHPQINRWEYYVNGIDGANVKLTNGTFAIKDESNNFTNYDFDEFGFLKN